MGLFNLFSKKADKPQKGQEVNKIYELLFCDNIELYKTTTNAQVYPWNILLSENPEIGPLEEISANKSLESRVRALAYHLLVKRNHPVVKKELLGVIVEVSMPNGLDVLASYSDGTARYLNYSGKILVWETETAESRELKNLLFDKSLAVINVIGPWDQPRKPAPSNGMLRLNFLVSDGLYFGEGQSDVIGNDPLAIPVLNAATQLMTYLVGQEK